MGFSVGRKKCLQFSLNDEDMKKQIHWMWTGYV